MARERRPRPVETERSAPGLGRYWLPPELGTSAAARDRAAALLELARARHHLERVFARAKKTPRVGGAPRGGAALDVALRAKADVAFAAGMRRPLGPIVSTAFARLLDLERRGLSSPDETLAAADDITRFISSTHTRVGAPMNDHDIPPEMSEDYFSAPAGALRPEIIGCGIGCGAPSAVGRGVPWSLLSRKGVPAEVARRRLRAAIERLPPKQRRRVLGRLRSVAVSGLIAGAIRDVQPTVGTSVAAPGWRGVTVGAARPSCSQVAGFFTP